MVDAQTILEFIAVALAVATVGLLTEVIRKAPLEYTKEQLEAVVDERLARQLHIVKGQVGEQLAPHMKEFVKKYDPADARFLGGKPVDYIVYKGYSRVYDTNLPIDEVVFVEVKTSDKGERGPDKNESKIRDAIVSKHVSYDVVTIRTDFAGASQPKTESNRG
jgi:predicted Holliday junction resolvase-like endonuclease